MLDTILGYFERWIDPYAARETGAPPPGAVAFIWHYVRQEKWPFAAMLALGGAVALMEIALFYFVGRLVDMLEGFDAASGWDGLLAEHGGELLFMALVVLVGRFIVVTFSSLIEEQAVVPGFFSLVRWQAASHVGRQSLSFFQNEFAGRVATKVWQSGQAIGDFMISMLQVAWFIVIYVIATLIMMADLDWRLAVPVLAWVAGFIVVARFFVPRIRRNSRDAAEAASTVSGRLVDSYSNIQTLKLFGRDDEVERNLRGSFDGFISVLKSFTRNLTGVRVSLAILSSVMTIAMAAIAVGLLLAGEITVGSVAATMAIVLRLSLLLGRMMNQLNILMRNYGVIQNSMELVARPVTLTDGDDATELVVSDCRIQFENVQFRYEESKTVLDGITLRVEPGQKVGLVGPSGAGKSTLVNLLLRFFDLDSGRIVIDGQDIAGVTQHSLRSLISVVTQDTSLLHRSIRDNIALGRPGAGEAELEEAARKAHAWRFIGELRDQRGRTSMDAHVGERGVKLSGGQRQRIAIARVMLKDAPILVLDEATSALDSEIEAAIQENLAALMEGKTVIAIAHRLSTIAKMDRLVVMDKGRIIEDGSHAELIARNGLYARLWERQSGGFINN
ncbi:ABC transporter ATP-binding protein/permease [Hoeflea sp. WL0058]|uniref:ABC transporter ATP-binding protein/permease n=1 Tax=Flavimaribacter sediminis TaxID=2865987 RepID=A0AAE3D1G3_9HYPH|nr:ABC transporter ATP-binding protein/permease [Flavimaribacter sediminis]